VNGPNVRHGFSVFERVLSPMNTSECSPIGTVLLARKVCNHGNKSVSSTELSSLNGGPFDRGGTSRFTSDLNHSR
jgi:hypothetical protein